MLALAILIAAQLYLGTVPAPDYGPPLHVVVRESALPGLDCGMPIAGACATLADGICTLYLPTAEAELWATLYTGLLPDQIVGHELSHCWLGGWHV